MQHGTERTPGFLREHARPMAGSLLVHGLLAGIFLVAASVRWSIPPTPVRAIEGYLVPARAQPRPLAPVLPAQPPAPAPEPRERVPPSAPEEPQLDVAQPDTATQAAQALSVAARALEDAHRAQAQREARIGAQAARRKAGEAKAKAQAQAQAERSQSAHAAAARAEQDAEARREADLARGLAQEEHRLGAENAGLLARYQADIRASVQRAWHRPPTARPGLRCVVYVTQIPGGEVVGVRIEECNGDPAVRQSIESAVYRASPLPAPPDPALFERYLKLEFAPDA